MKELEKKRAKAKKYRAMAYRAFVKNTLKAELKRHGVTYKELARRLQEAGLKESERNLANKISRGSFSAVFLLECLAAAGCEKVEIGPLQPPASSVR